MSEKNPITPAAADDPPVVKLAAKVAHELNNPLDAVLRLVNLAQRKMKSGHHADVERHLADAQFGLLRMAEILRELMDVGRQVAEVAPRRTLPLGELVAQAIRTVQAAADQRGVALSVVGALPARALDIRVWQVLGNLLKNALDAAPRDSAVRLAAAIRDQTLVMTIEDDGPGIDADFQPRLFTPFATTKPRGQGHGLGLAISREIVASLAGTITLENIMPQGCRATVTLPIAG